MNALEIVKKYLEENGYDGLYYPGECACENDDLAPCGEDISKCDAGYFTADREFYIGPIKQES